MVKLSQRLIRKSGIQYPSLTGYTFLADPEVNDWEHLVLLLFEELHRGVYFQLLATVLSRTFVLVVFRGRS